MALRSLGSTLVAKAGSGSALRKKEETRMGGMIPEQAAGAQPESNVRQNVQNPLEIAVPQGSQKAVSTQPIMQPKLDVGQGGLMPQMGGAAQAAATGRPIGSITSARAPMTQAGAAPVSGGANIATKLSNAFGSNLTPEQKTSYAKSATAPAGGAVKVANAAPTRYNPTGFLEGTLGGSVRADEPQTYDFNRNLAQGIASNLGGGIDAVGKFFQNFLGYSPGEGNVSENLQSFGNSPQASKDYGIMSNIRNAVSGGGGQVTPQAASTQRQSTPNPWQNPAPSYAKPQQKQTQSYAAPKQSTPAPKQNVVQQVSNWLRSLFK